MSPRAIAATPISSMPVAVTRAAWRGARASSAVSARVARPSAQPSSASPPATISATTAPVSGSPIATAARMAASAMTSTPSLPPSSERTTPIATWAATGRAVTDQTQPAGTLRPSASSAAPPARPSSTQISRAMRRI